MKKPQERILLTAPYKELAELAHRASVKLGIPLIVLEAMKEDAAQKILKLLSEHDIDVILSRGVTAQAIMDVVSIPVINIEASSLDVIRVISGIRKDKKIGMLTHSDAGDEEVARITNRLYTEYYYKNNAELIDKIELAKSDKIDVILTYSLSAVSYAKSIGMNSIHILPSLHTVENTLLLAQKVSDICVHEKNNTSIVKAILNISNDGIFLADEDDSVLYANQKALLLTGCTGAIDAETIKEISRQMALTAPLFELEKSLTTALITLGGVEVLAAKSSFDIVSGHKQYIYTLSEVKHIQQAERRIRCKKAHLVPSAKYTFDDIIANSPAMRQAIRYATKIARTESTALILGESGTGKEIFAHSIHNASSRWQKPFIAVNCAALPDSLLESELFGYAEGSFTGAQRGGKMGYFEVAHEGTLFLDEVGLLSTSAQIKLLRVLQEREVIRVGDATPIPVNVRIIAATNEDLLELVRKREFRPDLYYRLSVLSITLPPLRLRKDDIPTLLRHFQAQHCATCGVPCRGFSRDFLQWAGDYQWPGNVRELSNMVERLVLLSEDGHMDMPEALDVLQTAQGGPPLFEHDAGQQMLRIQEGTLKDMNNYIIADLLQRNGQRVQKVAKILGISRSTLWKKMQNMRGLPKE